MRHNRSVTSFTATPDDPQSPDVRALLERHFEFNHRYSPPEDVHALDASELAADGVTFFSIREDGVLLGMGALKQLDPAHAEVKSMHTTAPARGRGVARAMLVHLVETARARGCTRISLETGNQEAFGPARALYTSLGFVSCPPFNGYWEGSSSVFLTLEL
jgi:putative acetyltransferase